MGCTGKGGEGAGNYERESRSILIPHIEIVVCVRKTRGNIFALPVGGQGEFVAGTIDLTDRSQHHYSGQNDLEHIQSIEYLLESPLLVGFRSHFKFQGSTSEQFGSREFERIPFLPIEFGGLDIDVLP